LQQIAEGSEHDTTRVNALLEWSNMIHWANPDLDQELNQQIINISISNLKSKLSPEETRFFKLHQAIGYGNVGISLKSKGKSKEALSAQEKALSLRTELADSNGMAICINNIGNVYLNLGDYHKAEEYYNLSLGIRKALNQPSKMAASIGNLGLIAQRNGKYVKAIRLNMESLKLQEQANDLRGVALSYNNVGAIYLETEDIDNAEKYFQLGLEIANEMENPQFIAGMLGNLGVVFSERGDEQMALEYVKKAYAIQEEIEDRFSMAGSLNSMGFSKGTLNEPDSALYFFNQAETIIRELGDQRYLSSILINKARVYSKDNNEAMALRYLKEAKELAIGNTDMERIRESNQELYKLYKGRKDFENALYSLETYYKMRDSLKNEEVAAEMIKQNYQYQYEKKALADSIENMEAQKVSEAEIAAKDAKIAQDQILKYSLWIGVAFLLVFAAFVAHRLRLTQKQKLTIEKQKNEVVYQKEIVEEKNREITDSITYAQRIQSAILPPNKLIKEHLANSFILYKPKDIVAGDFYWLEVFEGKILFAVADCTGHGVPGAMVSVICNNGLNRSVREHQLNDPAKILDKTREIVIQEFEKSEEEVQDGMDIALCALKGNTLTYAGANNPLWIIRKNATEVEEIKADKQPIGKYGKPEPFTSNQVTVQPGDSIYLFSDGFVDQFGGEKGKKFKPANLRKLLLSVQDQSMEKQMELLDEAFETWRGDLEQIDDVCMIGVRV